PALRSASSGLGTVSEASIPAPSASIASPCVPLAMVARIPSGGVEGQARLCRIIARQRRPFGLRHGDGVGTLAFQFKGDASARARDNCNERAHGITTPGRQRSGSPLDRFSCNISRRMVPSDSVEKVLRLVKEKSGLPVHVEPDSTLPPNLFSNVTRARGAMPFHRIGYRPSASATPDYLIVYQCGFLLRAYAVPAQV